ncbi:hypothetical protein ALC56_10041 [Trachymyrmex septentrionalis]|uniref:Uncharacterized protein n=1 Tax=Trachymyrmex septentrionalis TaxID=34720 RepID=A0A195F5Y8_9HYME|nr:hypothetical protein ALC56_10041 [Trachymyrmex septentrionalis]
MKRVSSARPFYRGSPLSKQGTPSLTQLQDLMHVPPEHLFDPPRVPPSSRLLLGRLPSGKR